MPAYQRLADRAAAFRVMGWSDHSIAVCCEIPVAVQADESHPDGKSKSKRDGDALTLGAVSTC